jgi:methionyl-tRNA formyltransferase
MDEGPVYCFHKTDILESDNKINLEQKLTSLCIKNIKNDLKNILNKKITPANQNNAQASYCSKINKLSGRVNFQKDTTKEIIQKYKAFIGWPGLFFEKNNIDIKVHGLEEYRTNEVDLSGDRFKFFSNGLVAKTVDSAIVITYLQFPGKRIISASDAANSYARFFKE